jgi:hypothetical protein
VRDEGCREGGLSAPEQPTRCQSSFAVCSIPWSAHGQQLRARQRSRPMCTATTTLDCSTVYHCCCCRRRSYLACWRARCSARRACLTTATSG